MDVSISDIHSFLRCRRAWDIQSPMRQNLERIGMPSAALHVGTGVHVALAANANGARWCEAVDAWHANEVAEFSTNYRAQVGCEPSADEFVKLSESFNIVCGLVERYFARYTEAHPLGEHYRYVAVEQTFRVPIDGTDGTDGYLIGTFDGLARDEDERIWLVEHKAQPVSAVVWTPSGPKAMGDMRVGDTVCTPHNGHAQVVGVYPKGAQPVFRVNFKGGSATRATADHLWWARCIYHCGRGDWKLHTTLSLSEALQRGARVHIPLPGQVAFSCHDEYDIPLDPYVLGLLIGDGHLKLPGARFDKADYALVSNVAEVTETSIRALHGATEGSYSIFLGQRVCLILDELGLLGKGSPEKFVPDIYKYAAPEIRLALLQGLMDTDGSVGDKGGGMGQTRFSSASLRLAEDVAFLARSLGYRCSVISSPAYYTSKGFRVQARDKHVVNIGPGYCPDVFRISQKHDLALQCGKTQSIRIQSIEPDGTDFVQCIKLDNDEGLYITDDFIVTHNSYSVQPDLEKLSTNDQFTAYCWAAQALLGAPIAGILYDGIKRKLPSAPALLQSGKLSKTWNDSLDYATYLDAIDGYNLDADDYKDILLRLKERDAQDQTPFFTRWKINISPAQVQTFASYLPAIYRSMTNEPEIYPTFLWQGCWDCQVRDLCKAIQFGEDVEWMIRQGYTKGSGSQSFRQRHGTEVAVDATSFA